MADINSLLRKRQTSCKYQSSDWEIKESIISGKGVFANKNFQPRDLILMEIPLIIGPRAAPLPAGCVSCLKINKPLRACEKGCRLPVCGEECENSEMHAAECELLKRLEPKTEEHWSPLLYRALSPLRCLLLKEEDRMVINQLSANKKSKNVELLYLKEELTGELSEDELSFFELSCRVLNGVAFEIGVENDFLSKLRGLYPLAGMMNHSCAPNTKHCFKWLNGIPVMHLVATKEIEEGEEITTSYCPLMWSTMARRHFLSLTKEFFCSCIRCQDPTEFGTYFSAHLCECKGFLLPVSPHNIKSGWQCSDCDKVLDTKTILCKEAKMYENGKVSTHKANYLNIQKKLDTITQIGSKSKPYPGVSDEELAFKKKCIEDVFEISNKLRLGECRMKDDLISHLKDTKQEMKMRKENNIHN